MFLTFPLSFGMDNTRKSIKITIPAITQFSTNKETWVHIDKLHIIESVRESIRWKSLINPNLWLNTVWTLAQVNCWAGGEEFYEMPDMKTFWPEGEICVKWYIENNKTWDRVNLSTWSMTIRDWKLIQY